jgi:Domain of unknown function (DUF6475)
VTNDDRKRFAILMAGLSEYYDKRISDVVIEIYWNGLKDYDIDAIDKALKLHTHSDTGQFMPKISDIVKLIDGSSSDIAIQAWTKVEKAISAVGAYATVVFDDNIIQAVIRDMGSWTTMCHKKLEEMPFVAKEFQSRYRHYKTTNKDTNHPKVLIGLYEASNQLQGFKSQPPIPIGDEAKARLVYKTGGDKSIVAKISNFIPAELK